MYSLTQLKVLARSIHTATDQVHACRRHATAQESCSRSMYCECGAVRVRCGVSAPRCERIAVRARCGCCRRHVFTRERTVPTVCGASAMRCARPGTTATPNGRRPRTSVVAILAVNSASGNTRRKAPASSTASRCPARPTRPRTTRSGRRHAAAWPRVASARRRVRRATRIRTGPPQ